MRPNFDFICFIVRQQSFDDIRKALFHKHGQKSNWKRTKVKWCKIRQEPVDPTGQPKLPLKTLRPLRTKKQKPLVPEIISEAKSDVKLEAVSEIVSVAGKKTSEMVIPPPQPAVMKVDKATEMKFIKVRKKKNHTFCQEADIVVRQTCCCCFFP